MSNWSSRLSEQYHLNLPADVVAWFDGELWKECSETSFGQPLQPAQLLDSNSSALWGGLMLPDTLPILDNGCGDALCLRFNSKGTVSEVVHWAHEGGNWTPFGTSLCEALLLDAAITLMEEPLDGMEHRLHRLEDIGYAGWAFASLEGVGQRSRMRQILRQHHALPILGLLEAGVAETAVRRVLCERCCASGLQRYCHDFGGNQLATKLGVQWPVLSQWLFDTGLIPKEMERPLAKATGMSFEDLSQQDWCGAVGHAETVVALRTDLSWPFAVLGWAAERQGDLRGAIKHYSAGLPALATTSDFTEYWEKIELGQKTKFMVDRLIAIRDSLPPEVLENDYFKAVMGSKHFKDFFERVRRYWCERGALAESEGRYGDAYESYYGAGWDILVMDDMEPILDCIVRNAEAAGWSALASIAGHHRQSLL
ncbi:MAG: SMI1/KNR4 family protein [Gemmataceae bacterium]